MLKLARRRLPDLDEAEDVVHESFMKLAEKSDLREIRSVPAYLSQILNRSIASRLRHKGVVDRHLPKLMAEAEREYAPDASDAVTQNDQDRILGEAVDTLPSKQRRLLRMFAQGHSLSQIATAESGTANQMSCVINRAKKSVAKELGRRGFVHGLVPWPLLGMLRGKLRSAFTRADQLMGRAGMEMATLALGLVMVGVSLPGGSITPSTVPSKSEVSISADHVPISLAAHGSGQDARSSSSGTFTSGASAGMAPIERTILTFEAAGRQVEARERSTKNEPQPSVLDQLADAAREPKQIPLPQCGGLPICSATPRSGTPAGH